MGWSGNRGGQRLNPLSRTSASSFGPVGRYIVIVSFMANAIVAARDADAWALPDAVTKKSPDSHDEPRNREKGKP